MSRATRERMALVCRLWGLAPPHPNATEAGTMVFALAGAVLRRAPAHSGCAAETEAWLSTIPGFVGEAFLALQVAVAAGAAMLLGMPGDAAALRERFDLTPAIYRLALRDEGVPAWAAEVRRLASALESADAKNLALLNLR